MTRFVAATLVALCIAWTAPKLEAQTYVLRERIELGDALTVDDAFSTSEVTPNTATDASTLEEIDARPGYVTLRYLQERWELFSAGAYVGTGTLWIPRASGTDTERDHIAAILDVLRANWVQKNSPSSNEASAFFVEGFDLPSLTPTPLEWKLLSTSYRRGLLSGRQVLQAKIPGTTRALASVALTVVSYALVPQATRELGPKTLLQSTDWKWASRNVAQILSDAWDGKEPTSLETVKTLSENDVLRPNANVRVVYPVNQGESVTLTLTKGNLTVELAATSLETGRIGQSIRVRAETGKTFTADVVDWRLVRQDLP